MALAEQEHIKGIAEVMLINRLREKYNIKKQDMDMIRELNMLVKLKNNAEFAFVRDDRLVFSTKDYRIVTMDVKKVKEYLASVKSFINQIEAGICVQ